MDTLKTSNPEQLKIIAVNILDDCATHIRKNLQPNMPYKFYKEYALVKCNKIGKYAISYAPDECKPVDQSFFTNLFDTDLVISICAIVGKNGSGKSALIDIILRLINNYSYKIVGHEPNYAGAQLTSVNGVRAELYFAIGSMYYLLKQSGDNPADIKLYRWSDNRWGKQNDTKKVLGESFFYTILLNYSLYAFNTRDYGKEWKEKRHWLNGAFHKNDGYKAPVVLNPMRTEGNIDVNIENELAIDRLISMFLLDDGMHNVNFTEINDKNIVDSVVITLDEEGVNEKYERERERWLDAKFKKEDDSTARREEGITFDRVAYIIIDHWNKLYNFSHGIVDIKAYDIATRYLAYKTISAVQKYDAYNNFGCLQAENNADWDDARYAELDRLIREMNEDKSHITNKIRQTIAFLLFRHTKSGEMSVLQFSDSIKELLSDQWKPIYLIPAPCFATEIILKDRDTQAIYPFSMLSSGEKQLVYTTSTVLYHLRNLNSVKRSLRRVKYRHFNIIMDEIELYFHPEFQRRFISHLLTSISKLKFNEIDSINIIMSTHSPFILSDIPQQNIIFLEDGRPVERIASETFGANIHTLYKDNFFIKGMPIGEFAISKIERLFEVVNDMSIHDDAIYDEINMIGEPLLRTQLRKIYTERFPQIMKDKVRHLEDKVAYLESELRKKPEQ